MTKRKNRGANSENASQTRVNHGTHINAGRCRDCAQGIIGKVREGFEYFDQDNDGRGFWFCCYCGSNHVTVILDNGLEIEQGDLYEDDGTLNL